MKGASVAEANRIKLPYNWTPRGYQERAWEYLRGPAERKRAVLVWHRRAGKDLLSVNHACCSAFERIGTYWHVFPFRQQAQMAIWRGITSEGEIGNEGQKGTRFLDHIPPQIVDRTYENEMRIQLVNGSQYMLVGSDNYNGLVGNNVVGVILSEYSLQDPAAWQFISPMLSENGGWAMFIYTMRGRNHGYTLAQHAKSNPDWFYDEREAGSGPNATKKPNGQPVISDEEIEKLRKEGMPEATIQSEFYNNPDAPLEGAFWEKEMQAVKKEGRICDLKYEPKLPVYTVWDIGRDMTVIIFYQLLDQEIRIIDCYSRTGEGLPHFVNAVKSKPYLVYEKHYGPWDLAIKDWGADKSRKQIAADLGINFHVMPQKPTGQTRADGIEQVALILPRCIFNGSKCQMLLDGLRSYRSEPDQSKMQFTGDSKEAGTIYKEEPLHDWASHFGDCMRYLAVNLRVPKKWDSGAYPDKAVDTYQYV